jgi:hypothetical protein
MPKRFTLILLGGVLFSLAFSAAASAEVETPGTGWEATSTMFPTNIAPAGGTGILYLDVFNIGARPSYGPITVTDVLPPGLLATDAGDVQVTGPIGAKKLWECKGNAPGESPHKATQFKPASVVTCTNTALLPTLPIPEQPSSPSAHDNGVIAQIALAVEAVTGESGTLMNQVTVAGGGAVTTANTSSPVMVSPESTPPFGFLNSDGWFGSTDGTVDTQAGSHPHDFTYSFDLTTAMTTNGSQKVLSPTGRIRNLAVKLPPGFIGNPTAVPQCTRQQFDKAECSPSTQVGVVSVGNGLFSNLFRRPYPTPLQVYNIVPPHGVPARFGFFLFGVETFLDFTVRSGGDYGITAHVNDIVQKFEEQQAFEVINARFTMWGEPSDPAHDDERFSTTCQEGCSSTAPRVPLLTLPTACPTEAQAVSASVNTWEPGNFGETSFLFHTEGDVPSSFTGCDHLGFAPSMSIAPDTSHADTPAGLTVDVRVPQEGLTTPGALATSNIKETIVELPKGVVINPGQAAGLQACQQGDIPGGDDLPLAGENGEEERFAGPADCPNAAKVGTVQIATPILKEDLEGNVYVLQSDPPNLKLLIAASGEGVNIKLIAFTSLCENAGETIDGHACEAPGQLITRIPNVPEAPVTDFKLSFSGGAQAALDTPIRCGTYTTTSDFTPWSTPSVLDAFPSSNFNIEQGPGGAPCPGATVGFSPTMIAGSTSDRAGAFADFSLLLQRGDDQQRIEKLAFKEPAGLGGVIAGVPLCGEPQASQGTCPTASQIGHAVVDSGPGPYPLVLPQPGAPELPIYLTGPYKGAPFGLSIVTPVVAGPFNLGTIVTRAKVEVDPKTVQISVVTDPLPQEVDGVATDLRSIDSVIDRPGFIYNPSNCDPQQFTGTATGTEGAVAPLASSFGMGSCRELEFHPKVSGATRAHASKANGAELRFVISYPKAPQGTQAWLKELKLDLPKQLPSRLTTIQKACPAATFETDRGACPAASIIGHAIVHTSVLPVPLEGSIYDVSHGGAKFPDVVLVLKGDGVTLEEVGEVFIKNGITSTTFKAIPDAPFENIEVTLPTGPYSQFSANLPHNKFDFCGQNMKMPTAFVAQNGLEVHQSTPIGVTGCPKAHKATKHQKKARKGGKHQQAKKSSGHVASSVLGALGTLDLMLSPL